MLPEFTLRCCGFQFLKKSPLTMAPQTADAMLRIISRIAGDAGREITVEAEMLSGRSVTKGVKIAPEIMQSLRFLWAGLKRTSGPNFSA